MKTGCSFSCSFFLPPPPPPSSSSSSLLLFLSMADKSPSPANSDSSAGSTKLHHSHSHHEHLSHDASDQTPHQHHHHKDAEEAGTGSASESDHEPHSHKRHSGSSHHLKIQKKSPSKSPPSLRRSKINDVIVIMTSINYDVIDLEGVRMECGTLALLFSLFLSFFFAPPLPCGKMNDVRVLSHHSAIRMTSSWSGLGG